jgi:hypothetical protein
MAFAHGHPKVGGRKKGTPNRISVARQQEIMRIVADSTAGHLPEDTDDILPLEAMLLCLKWAIAAQDRPGILAAATAAAPYVHPRLSATELHVSHSLDNRPTADILIELTALRLKEEEAASDEASDVPSVSAVASE